LANGAASVAQSLPVSSKTERTSLTYTRLSKTKSWVIPARVPVLGAVVPAGKRLGQERIHQSERSVGQFQCFEPPETLVTQRPCSTESNICSAYPFPSQPWATRRSLVTENKRIVDTAPWELCVVQTDTDL